MGKRNINIIHTKLRHVCSYLIMIYSDENSLIVIFALMDGCLFFFVFENILMLETALLDLTWI